MDYLFTAKQIGACIGEIIFREPGSFAAISAIGTEFRNESNEAKREKVLQAFFRTRRY